MARAASIAWSMKAAALAGLLLSLGLAGCLVQDGVSVPQFHVGDWAAYSDGTQMTMTGEVTVHYPDEDAPRDVVELLVERPNEVRGNTTHVRIDPATGYAIESTTLCAHFMEGQCWQNLTETWFARDWGVPWGYGASLFAGMTLHEGDFFERTFETRHGPAQIGFTVDSVFVEDGETRARIDAGPVGALPENATAGLVAATFVVGSSSPFVVSVDGTIPDLEDGRSPSVRVVKSIQRTDQGPGSLPLMVPLSGTQSVSQWEAIGPPLGFQENVPPRAAYWFARLDGSFEEALEYAEANELVTNRSDVVRMTMARGGWSQTGPSNATISETQETRYSLFVQTAAEEVTEYEIVRENRSQAAGLAQDASFTHRVDQTFSATGARVGYGHKLGLDSAARMIEENLPYATQFVSVGPDPDGIFGVDADRGRMTYTFSWWHNMYTPPGESWGGIRQSVDVDAEAGLLRYVYGPHEGPGDAGPWSVVWATAP